MRIDFSIKFHKILPICAIVSFEQKYIHFYYPIYPFFIDLNPFLMLLSCRDICVTVSRLRAFCLMMKI